MKSTLAMVLTLLMAACASTPKNEILVRYPQSEASVQAADEKAYADTQFKQLHEFSDASTYLLRDQATYAISKQKFLHLEQAIRFCESKPGFSLATIDDFKMIISEEGASYSKNLREAVRFNLKDICMDPSFGDHVCDPSGEMGWMSPQLYSALFGSEYRARKQPLPEADIFTIIDGQGEDENPELLSRFNDYLVAAHLKKIELPAVCTKPLK